MELGAFLRPTDTAATSGNRPDEPRPARGGMTRALPMHDNLFHTVS